MTRLSIISRLLSASAPAAMLLALSACKGPAEKSPAGDFPRSEALVAIDSIDIRQILSPTGWSISADKVVVLSKTTDTLFYVYRLPGFEYLYCFGRKGQGPDDFAGASLQNIEPARPEYFAAEDYQRHIRHYYRLGEEAAQRTASETFPTYGCLLAVNDSVSLQFGVRRSDCTGNTSRYFRTVSPKGEPLDSIIPPVYSKAYKITVTPEGTFLSGYLYNVPKPVYRQGRLVLFYGDVRRIEAYDISAEGHFTLRHSSGDQSTEEQINAMDLENRAEGETIVGLFATDENIYALSGDYRTGKNKQREFLRSYIEVYDWDGRALRKYALERGFNNFLIDTAHGRAFCYDNRQDFDRIFVYDIAMDRTKKRK